MPGTPHQRAEAELTAYGLTFPETTHAPAWLPTRGLYVRRKMFAVFGAKAEPLDALTLLMKLPVSAEMAEELPFVRPARGWFKQHNWVTAHFGPEDNVLAEMATLRGWLKQSYIAVAPKKLGRALADGS
ncbi:MAG TPA: MmcQ/YjbR family DNA-binding protein [Candidatus Binatia bacterium]|nr:MmcQ/YjbR family DNA-binding protein [Candidatus Binatia bacterium]